MLTKWCNRCRNRAAGRSHRSEYEWTHEHLSYITMMDFMLWRWWRRHDTLRVSRNLARQARLPTSYRPSDRTGIGYSGLGCRVRVENGAGAGRRACYKTKKRLRGWFGVLHAGATKQTWQTCGTATVMFSQWRHHVVSTPTPTRL